MSVAIATMGMFTPPGGTRIEYITNDTGSSDGWWLRPKPVVIIRNVTEDDYKIKPAIKIIEITNGKVV